ncbi:MAG TPA: patatin-like phospholipase family protein [Rhodanobacteraceae bacterium]|nr:patatin-like phospholipase family protein [Rhodanobacteraceae bacterium]
MAVDIAELLRRNAALRHLEDGELAAVAARMREQTVPGGQTLFAPGEAADTLYILKSGALGLFRPPHAGGQPRLAGIISSGEMVGALGLLTRERRLYRVGALRDSVVLSLSRAAFVALARRHPNAMLAAVQIALERLLPGDEEDAKWQPRSFALLPFDGGLPARATAERLRAALAPFGDCLVIDSDLGRGHAPGWYAEREAAVHFVLYVDDGDDPAWRDLCRRQADALLLLADAREASVPWPDRDQLDAHAAMERPRHLLLLQPADAIIAGAARRWRASLECRVQHHHLRDDGDVARLARLLARRSHGLVLSGGGARGFAAIGVIRALRQAGVEFDAVGGTSIGAIVGAGVACAWDDARIYAANRHAFVDNNPLADWTLPLVAFSRGGRTCELLREAFGERDIEDLPLPFFCVSANLTKGTAQVHREGPLWLWLRASSAVPGVLPPVLHDGDVFVDGAVINNLPTDIMADDSLAEITACDIDADEVLEARIEGHALPNVWRQWQQRALRPDLLSILWRAGMVNAEGATEHRRALADRCLAPRLGGIGMLEWGAYDHAVDTGYRFACEVLGLTPRT